MNPADIPRFNSTPVLGDTPQQAFRIDPETGKNLMVVHFCDNGSGMSLETIKKKLSLPF